VIGRPDARQHQELRRVHRAARQDDVAAAERHLVLAVDPIAHAHGAVAVEDDALDQGVRDHLTVVLVALDRRPQIGARGAPALLVLLRHLPVADAILPGAVEVLDPLVAGLLAGLEEALVDLRRIDLVGDIERPAGAVEVVGAASLFSAFLKNAARRCKLQPSLPSWRQWS